MPPAIADSATATARPPPPTSWALRSSLALGRRGQEAVQLPLGLQVGLGDPPGHLAQDHLLVVRAVERARAGAGQQHDVALVAERRPARRARRRRGRRPRPTTGVGQDRRGRRARCRARRCPRRPAARARCTPRPCPRSPRPARSRSRRSSGFPKLRQLVTAAGRAPGAGDVAGRLADGAHPAAARVEPGAPAVAVERDRDGAAGRREPHDARRRRRAGPRCPTRPAGRTAGSPSGGWRMPGRGEQRAQRRVGRRRRDPRAATRLVHAGGPAARRSTLVARARRRSASSTGMSPTSSPAVEGAQVAGLGHLADHGRVDLPAPTDRLDRPPTRPARRSPPSAPATPRS